ncbi:MAG: glycosyltransferase family 4 protein [Bacteroidales bacterium]|nr:glycosyltransferase family 4 protein [Bacteroidales bacterium]
MKLVFVLYNYFPYGGLQRDFLRIAEACSLRGHHITALTSAWEGEVPDWLELSLLEVRALTNHGFNHRFAEQVRQRVAQLQPDVVVGFNRMAGLDVYFAADPCFAAHTERQGRGWLYRLTSRYRHFVAEERGLMDSDALILALTGEQIDDYRRCYGVAEQRFQLLPPGIARDRAWSAESPGRRRAFRTANGVADDERVLLMVGSGFRRKGVDRAVAGLGSLPAPLRDKTHLFVVGDDDPAPFQRQAQQCGVAERVHFVGGRDDIPDFLFGADLFLHPARSEAAGMVLVEAIVSGLPVLVTAVCGYAHFIEDSGCGEVLDDPFHQDSFNARLRAVLENDTLRRLYHDAGVAFGADADVYDMPARVALLIEGRGAGADQGGGRGA